MRPTLSALPLAFALLQACARGPEPCASASSCPTNTECLANRCVPAGSDPVALDTRRIVLSPSAIAVVTARDARADDLAPAVTFGGRAGGASALYLRFQPLWREARRVDSAFLVLEPL